MFSFDDIGGRLPKPDRPGDTACGHGMIASDHDHPDASLAAVLDRVRHVGAGRVLRPTSPTNVKSSYGGASDRMPVFVAQASTRRP